MAVAVAAWVGALAGPVSPPLPFGLAAGALALRRRAAVLVVAALVAGGLSGWWAADRAAATREAVIPEGRVIVAGRVDTDPVSREGRELFRLRPTDVHQAGWTAWEGPALGVVALEAPVTAGDRVVVAGDLRRRPGNLRGDPVAGWLTAGRIEVIGGAGDPLWAAGNLLRRRVLDGLTGRWDRPEAALLAGFLIGETGQLPEADVDALRRTGLTHFVAVSGSNVALFLAAWWLAAGPLAWGPRRRAVLGLIGLAVFLVVTRWEPSVIRASTMAGLVLGGRLAGIAVDAWTALGGAVTVLILVSGDLAGEVGFQLSVAATAGVLAGAGLGARRRPRWLWAPLAATAAAQVAVAPLLLLHFGGVPVMAPMANLLAAPLVAAATGLGGIGVVIGVKPLTGLGLLCARSVLAVARGMRHLPQLGVDGAALAALGAAAARRPGWRPLVAAGAAVALLGMIALPLRPPGGPEMRVLDVGQGDAILLRSPDGAVVLVDGGPDPAVLRDKLFALGIRRIDLVVITHRHADHTAGLAGLGAVFEVRRIWHPDDPEIDIGSLAALGAVVETPGPGWQIAVGSLAVEVLGPQRRYDSPNDASVVLLVTAAGRTALLAGDIEVTAQRELGPIPVDVLKVPHQGAATSDPEWLASTGASLAIVSVGPNDFGHPDAAVLALLEAMGSDVRRTDREGDVVVRLDRLPGVVGLPRSARGRDEPPARGGR